MQRSFFLFVLFACCIIFNAKANSSSIDTTKGNLFTEGVLQTRVTFPGNPMNEFLSAINPVKGAMQQQLAALQDVQKNDAYTKRINAALNKMSATEQLAMSQMMMAALMSPLYATIYFDKDKALAKAYALNYTLESFMNTQEGKGKMVAVANDNSNAAAITFSAKNLQKAWEKEQIDATHYNIQWLTESETVSGIACKKAVYTKKAGPDADEQGVAQKLVVWYSTQFSNRINFAHPFYLDLPYGILKIEVFYDSNAKNRMIYEVTGIEQRHLQAVDFEMHDVQPILDWDADPMGASMKMVGVFMSQNTKQDQ